MAVPAILQQLGRSQQAQAANPLMNPNNLAQVKKIKNMVNVVRSAGNPQALLQTMISQNPQMQQAMQYVNENGGDPKAAFEKLAAEQGADPQDIMNLFR